METDGQIIRRLEAEVDKLRWLNDLHEKVGREILAENRELRVRLRTIHEAMEDYHG